LRKSKLLKLVYPSNQGIERAISARTQKKMADYQNIKNGRDSNNKESTASNA